MEQTINKFAIELQVKTRHVFAINAIAEKIVMVVNCFSILSFDKYNKRTNPQFVLYTPVLKNCQPRTKIYTSLFF